MRGISAREIPRPWTCEHNELVNCGHVVIGFDSLDALPVPPKHDVLGQTPSILKAEVSHLSVDNVSRTSWFGIRNK